MDATRGADDARQEGVGDTRPSGVGLPVEVHLGRAAASRSLSGWACLSAPLRLTSAMWLPPNSWMRATSMMRLVSPPMLAPLMTRSPCPALPFCFFTVGMLRLSVDKVSHRWALFRELTW